MVLWGALGDAASEWFCGVLWEMLLVSGLCDASMIMSHPPPPPPHTHTNTIVVIGGG